jgi:hypothetical protein
MKYLTIVYKIPETFDVSTLTEHESMTACSWSHAIDEKNDYKKKLEELLDGRN